MQFKGIKTVVEEWSFFKNKLEYYKKDTNKMFYYKEVKNKKLLFAVSPKKEDLEKNIVELPFYGEDLLPISSGEVDQTFTTEDIDPLEIEVWNKQLVRKKDAYIFHTDSYGGELIYKQSLWSYELEFEISDGKSIFYTNAGYNLSDIYKKAEEFVCLFKNLKIGKLEEKIPVVIIDQEFYENFATCFFGPEIKEKLVWTAYDQEIYITVKEDPCMKKPHILFDDDGLKTKRKIVAKDGKINPLYDVYFAYKYNEKPTGNGFYGLSANGVGYSYLIFDGGEKMKLEEFNKILLAFNFLGWHTCSWKEGRISVTIDCGILFENGIPSKIILNIPLAFDLKKLLRNPILLKEEYIFDNVKFYPLVVTQ